MAKAMMALSSPASLRERWKYCLSRAFQCHQKFRIVLIVTLFIVVPVCVSGSTQSQLSAEHAAARARAFGTATDGSTNAMLHDDIARTAQTRFEAESRAERYNRLLDVWRKVEGQPEAEWRGGDKSAAEKMAQQRHSHRLWGLDLGCSACLWSAKRVLFRFSASIRGMKRGKQREPKAREALPQVCEAPPEWPTMGIVGQAGEREFVDVVEAEGTGNSKAVEAGLLKDQGDLGRLKMIGFCQLLVDAFGEELVEAASIFKGRVGEMKFGRWLCFEQFDKGGLCSAARAASSDGSVDGESEDEEEEL